jgi:hypothetical protein
MQEWVQAESATASPSSTTCTNGLDAFVDQVVPILRRRGLRPGNYLGASLRDHLGLPEQLGLDPG